MEIPGSPVADNIEVQDARRTTTGRKNIFISKPFRIIRKSLTPQSEAKNSWLKLATQEQNQLFFVLLN
jgi:hypothetical protein